MFFGSASLNNNYLSIKIYFEQKLVFLEGLNKKQKNPFPLRKGIF